MKQPRFRVVVTSGYEVKDYSHRYYTSGNREYEIAILDSACGFKVVKRKVVTGASLTGNRTPHSDSRLARYVHQMEREAAALELELA